MTLLDIKNELQKLKKPAKAKLLRRFFKTGPGEYGEGDIFLGIVVPLQRQVAKKYTNLSLVDLKRLLNSKIHEYRLTALFILIKKYKLANEKGKKKIFNLYLASTKYINNWDLVDLSAPNIVGHYLLTRKRSILYKLACSKSLWQRRIAILACLRFIRDNDFNDTINISEILLKDEHDLIHKAVGWMLREIGKRDLATEEDFLKKYYKVMPRTMLRYAIERFPEKKRLKYLKGKI